MEISDNNDHLKRSHKRLFATLLTDPEKKAKVLELLTQEGLIQACENMSPNSPLKRSKFNSPLKKLHEMMMSPKPRMKKIESPSALGRRRALQRLESDSSLDETQEKSIRPRNAPEVPYNEILKKIIVYCEVRSNGEDRSSSIKTMVRALGATVRDKITRDVTHVIFKDGLYSTFRKAQNMKMHIVSVLWLDAVRRFKCQMPEDKYKPLDFDKYNNMNESQVCQEIEEEFNDVLTDEIKRSSIKKRNFESRISTESFSNQNPSDDDAPNDVINRSGFITPSIPSSRSSRCSTPISNPKTPKNITKDVLVVPCSQNDSHSFTHARKSTNLSRVIEETFNDYAANNATPSNIAKHVRDSFELKKMQKLKSPPQEIPKKSSNESAKLSINDEESLNLHVTSTTDQSLSSRRRSSSNYAQDLLTKTSERNSTSSLDSLTNKTRRRTTIGLSRSKTSLEENVPIIEKTNHLLNDVDNLLNDKPSIITPKKNKVRKLFKGDTIDETLFNWDKHKTPDVVAAKATTPPKKRKVELPPDFPKILSTKARKKVSTNKKSAPKIIPPKESLAKILDFGEKEAETEKKSTQDDGEKSTQNEDEKSTENEEEKSTQNDNNNKRPRRKSIVPINYKSMIILTDDSDETQSPDKPNKTDPNSDESFKSATSNISKISKKRKNSRVTISSISSGNSDDDNENIFPKNKRKTRLTISSISSGNSSTKSSSQITQIQINTPIRSTRQSSIMKSPKTPKTPKNVIKTPNINRRSTMEFLPRSSRKSLARIKASEGPKQLTVKISSIVCSRFHRADSQIFAQIVKKIGGFFVEDEVSKRTTHLVCGGPIRTVNMLRAIARGCWILRKEWLFKSLEAGRWIEEEDYEMVEFSPAVQKCRLEKQSFGSLYSMDLFKNCGTIFISRGSNPRSTDLEELVQLCGGRIVRIVRDADIIVGERTRNENNNSVSVTEKWILDSITDNKKKNFKNYQIFSSER